LYDYPISRLFIREDAIATNRQTNRQTNASLADTPRSTVFSVFVWHHTPDCDQIAVFLIYGSAVYTVYIAAFAMSLARDDDLLIIIIVIVTSFANQSQFNSDTTTS